MRAIPTEMIWTSSSQIGDGTTLDLAKKRVSDYLMSKYAAKFNPRFPQNVGSNVIKAYQVTAFAP